jgi:hypothetical protein
MVKHSEDWFLIERAEHDGRRWYETYDDEPEILVLRTSARISDADVEGTADDMLAIAAAIEERGSYSARRCAVTICDGMVRLHSPRNSSRDGVVSIEDADELAALIRQELT